MYYPARKQRTFRVCLETSAEDSASCAVSAKEVFWKKLPARTNTPGCAENLCRAEPLSHWFYGEDFGRRIAPKLHEAVEKLGHMTEFFSFVMP